MDDNSINIDQKIANQLLNHIVEALYNESANILSEVCQGFGLREGTVQEALENKRNYVNSRIRDFSPNEIFILAKKLEGKYEGSELDKFLAENNFSDGLILISKFDDIKEAIVEQILKANYVVWVAVSWFTDKDLANELYKKSQEGINVQIILNDDKINSVLIPKLKLHFEVFEAPVKEPYLNLMHNKFCMIDFRTVIHGSYNWTNKAQFNDETVSIIENGVSSKEFADQFIKTKRRIIQDRTQHQ